MTFGEMDPTRRTPSATARGPSPSSRPRCFDRRPPPLGVYVHWPYCARICPYCDFNVVRDAAAPTSRRRSPAPSSPTWTPAGRARGPAPLVSIFFGGGTPSLMDPAWPRRSSTTAAALDAVRPTWKSRWRPTPPTPRPPASRPSPRPALNRLSLGLQSLDDEALKLPRPQPRRRRRPPRRRDRRAALPAPVAGPDLRPPRPDARRLGRRARPALDAGPEHLSPYQLTIEAGTAFDRAVRPGSFTPPTRDRAPSCSRPPRRSWSGAASTPTRSPTTRAARRPLPPQPRLLAGRRLCRRRPRRPRPDHPGGARLRHHRAPARSPTTSTEPGSSARC